MSVDAIRAAVESAIQRASTATGVDFSFLLGTAKRESGYNPAAKAQTSSAAGLFQFTEQTWLATLKKYGAKHGYARYADLIAPGADGRLHVAGAEARRTVMDLRLDVHAASLMAGELTSEHASYLRGRVGRDPTPGELYAAHVLGPQGSARLIEAAQNHPGSSAASLFPDAAAANHGVFYRQGRAASVGEVYASLTRPVGGAPVRLMVSEPVLAAAPATTPAGFLEYATGRRLDRLEQERALVDIVLRGSQEPDALDGSSSTTSLARSMFSSDMLRVLSEARHGRDG